MLGTGRIFRAALLLVTGSAAIAAAGCGGGGKTTSTAAQNNAFTGSGTGAVLNASAASPSFHRNQPVVLRVTIANMRDTPISVSSTDMGTLHVTALTRNGQPVSPRSTTVDTIVPLGSLIHSKLGTLNTGGAAAIDWQSNFDQGVGGQALDSVTLQSIANADDLYSVATPGHYVLSLDYSYPSAANPEPSTLQGPTNQATVSFDVVP